ncbi:RNA polymerase sigma factor [Hymenobacter sp. BT730]|uniref:RNA polymerase sigma factor n=1 Tax=Hymenobacter sp. BT730 TaxID=3063332 RepID=UPI0026DF16C9|nr:RNA polymerase sigma factor [Hymenobacter sp. BT730]
MPYTPLSDLEVIHRVLSGEKQLFELLMRRYNQRLYRTGLAALGGNVAGVEETMQNAWIKAYQHLSRFEGRASFPTWLTRIMLNECLMSLRGQHRLVELPQPEATTEASLREEHTPLHDVLNEELRQALETAIGTLPNTYRSVFMLREVEGMSVVETAQMLHLSETNVKVRLLRARERLRSQLQDFAPAHTFTYLGPRCDAMVHHVLARMGEVLQEAAPQLQ